MSVAVCAAPPVAVGPVARIVLNGGGFGGVGGVVLGLIGSVVPALSHDHVGPSDERGNREAHFSRIWPAVL